MYLGEDFVVGKRNQKKKELKQKKEKRKMDLRKMKKDAIKGAGWNKEAIYQSIRGLRNGIITGVNIRRPYIIQAAVMYLLFFNSDKT